jgi:hypothetical protein
MSVRDPHRTGQRAQPAGLAELVQPQCRQADEQPEHTGCGAAGLPAQNGQLAQSHPAAGARVIR